VALGVVQFRVGASHVVRLEITMVDAKNEPCTIAHACCHAGCSALACSSLRGRAVGPSEARSRGPARRAARGPVLNVLRPPIIFAPHQKNHHTSHYTDGRRSAAAK
jgi:hypothetical protein